MAPLSRIGTIDNTHNLLLTRNRHFLPWTWYKISNVKKLAQKQYSENTWHVNTTMPNICIFFRLYLYFLNIVLYFFSSTPVLTFSIDVVFILSIFQFFVHLTYFVVAILVKFYCFTNLFVPSLEVKSMVPGWWPPERVSIVDGPYWFNRLWINFLWHF